MNQEKRLFVELYTKGTSYPVYDEVVDENTLQVHVRMAMFEAPEVGRIFDARIGGHLDAQIGGYYIMGVFVPASMVYHALSDADEVEADEIFENYVEVTSYDITQKLLERGLCDVDNVGYCVTFRLLDVVEKGIMKAIAGLDGDLGTYPVTTINDTAWTIYDAHKGLFDKDNTTFDEFITTLYADGYFSTDHIRVILSENAKVYMHNNDDTPYGEMGAWELPSGVVVEEVDYDYDLHAFDVYYKGRKHTVVPKDIGDMMECIADLNAGADPVFDGWNDGLGYNLLEVLLHGQDVV